MGINGGNAWVNRVGVEDMTLTLEQEMRIEIIISRDHNNFWAKELEKHYPLYLIIQKKLKTALKEYQKGVKNDTNKKHY